jgi:small GTP-binding protein
MELKEVNKKIILLGDGKVGKTSIVSRYLRDTFDEGYIPGTGMVVYPKSLQFSFPNLVINLKMSICDMCGQKAYGRIRDTSMTGGQGIIIVGDLARPETISSIDEFWREEVRSTMGILPTVYFGNKLDLVDRGSAPAKLLEATGNKTGTLVILGSAKTGESIKELFDKMGEMLVADLVSAPSRRDDKEPTTIMDVLDRIVQDFCAQYGDMEKGMTIVQNQFRQIGLDLRKPSVEGLMLLIDRFKMIEGGILSRAMASANYDERKALIESLEKKEKPSDK